MKKSLSLFIGLFLWFSFTGELCTKAIVYGKDYHTEPRAENYAENKDALIDAIESTLKKQGYHVHQTDRARGRVTTGWLAVEADSHYYDFFGRKDYGVSDGSYYQLIIDLQDAGSQTRVSVATILKTVAGRLHSSGKLERRFHTQLSNFLRSPQIEMTNVGVTKK